MLQALLRGKLSPEQENLEDILTSNVFGLFRYLPPESGLFPLLRLGSFANGTRDDAVGAPGQAVSSVEFWPTYSYGGVAPTEPDVLIRAQDADGSRHIILVEVKLRSPKTSGPDPNERNVTDQLAREWYVLVQLCREEGASPHLLYVTADPHYPHVEVGESAVEYSAKMVTMAREYPFQCAWLSWQRVAEVFLEAEEPALRDISLMCLKLDLVPFRGFPVMTPANILWGFAVVARPYHFRGFSVMSPANIMWGFAVVARPYHFATEAIEYSWSYLCVKMTDAISCS